MAAAAAVGINPSRLVALTQLLLCVLRQIYDVYPTAEPRTGYNIKYSQSG